MSKSELIRPTEGIWFKVNPLTIDQSLFKIRRQDRDQEEVRQIILEAFADRSWKANKNSSFKLLIPVREWTVLPASALWNMACELGDRMSCWVEQAFGWAQRIANQEPWEDVCNKADILSSYRLVTWKDGFSRLVGGSNCDIAKFSSTAVSEIPISDNDYCDITVPLVVKYD